MTLASDAPSLLDLAKKATAAARSRAPRSIVEQACLAIEARLAEISATSCDPVQEPHAGLVTVRACDLQALGISIHRATDILHAPNDHEARLTEHDGEREGSSHLFLSAGQCRALAWIAQHDGRASAEASLLDSDVVGFLEAPPGYADYFVPRLDVVRELVKFGLVALRSRECPSSKQFVYVTKIGFRQIPRRRRSAAA